MMMSDHTTDVESCYDAWSESYFEAYYGADAPYPPVHVKLIIEALRAHGAQRVLDAGCGPASILRTLVSLHFDCSGFDLSPGMVAEAQRALQAVDFPAERIWQGDAAQASSYPNDGTPFDAAIAIGVMPHLSPAQAHAMFENLRNAVAPGGLVLVQARNALFSLFTLNRNTHEFVRDELLRVESLAADEARSFVETGLAEATKQLRMDLPENRGGAGYDDTQPRTENPLTLPRKLEACGFRDVRTLFYHYHALPPMCEGMDATQFRAMSVAMERELGPSDWRGHFLASSFIVSGVRA